MTSERCYTIENVNGLGHYFNIKAGHWVWLGRASILPTWEAAQSCAREFGIEHESQLVSIKVGTSN